MSREAEEAAAHEAERDAIALAKALLSLAKTAGMPDSYFETDSRVLLAKRVLAKYAAEPGSRR